MYLIDPEGTIVRLDLRGKALDETLSRLIKRPAADRSRKPSARPRSVSVPSAATLVELPVIAASNTGDSCTSPPPLIP